MNPDFSGEYVLDRGACTLSSGGAAFHTAVMRIDHQEPVLRCSARFVARDKQFEYSFERMTDGRELAVRRHQRRPTGPGQRLGIRAAIIVSRTAPVRPARRRGPQSARATRGRPENHGFANVFTRSGVRRCSAAAVGLRSWSPSVTARTFPAERTCSVTIVSPAGSAPRRVDT
jgi:hypothetical protein